MTTVTYPNLPTSVSDVSVALMDETKLMNFSDEWSADHKTYTATFLYTGTDISNPVLIEVKRTLGGKIFNRIEIKLRAVELVDDGVNLPVAYPVEFFIGWNIATLNSQHDLAAFMKAIGTLYSLTFRDVSTKVPNTAIITGLLQYAVAVYDV